MTEYTRKSTHCAVSLARVCGTAATVYMSKQELLCSMVLGLMDLRQTVRHKILKGSEKGCSIVWYANRRVRLIDFFLSFLFLFYCIFIA